MGEPVTSTDTRLQRRGGSSPQPLPGRKERPENRHPNRTYTVQPRFFLNRSRQIGECQSRSQLVRPALRESPGAGSLERETPQERLGRTPRGHAPEAEGTAQGRTDPPALLKPSRGGRPVGTVRGVRDRGRSGTSCLDVALEAEGRTPRARSRRGTTDRGVREFGWGTQVVT